MSANTFTSLQPNTMIQQAPITPTKRRKRFAKIRNVIEGKK